MPLELIGRSQELFTEDLDTHNRETSDIVKDATFLVIGGAGSIGQAVTKEIFARNPRKLHVVDISENNLVELVRDLRSTLGYISGDFQTFALDIADAIDELLVLNVSRNDTDGQKNFQNFCEALKEVVEGVFVPVAAGGGVLSVDHACDLLASGADKVIVNSALFDSPAVVREIAATYGSQCVVASIDYKWTSDGGTQAFKQNGTTSTGLTVEQAAEWAVSLGAGELYIQSMDRDGTGQGYDLETLKRIAEIVDIPVIAAGGVGGSGHLVAWLSQERGFAACTANIFNFLGGGLLEARQVVTASHVPLANWEFGWRPGSR